MDKILAEILLPATGQTYELWIPCELRVYEAGALVSKILGEREGTYYVPDAHTALFNRSTGQILPAASFVGALGLSNGCRLMLV
jgi:hypothetical protein